MGDPMMTQDGNFEYGMRKWGRVLYAQLTPGMKNSEEIFLDPFHFTYVERCTLSLSGYCNEKEGSYVTGEFPPSTQLSHKSAQDGRMASVYIRLRSSVTVHHNVRMNKTILDAAATIGGAIGMMLVVFNFV